MAYVPENPMMLELSVLYRDGVCLSRYEDKGIVVYLYTLIPQLEI